MRFASKPLRSHLVRSVMLSSRKQARPMSRLTWTSGQTRRACNRRSKATSVGGLFQSGTPCVPIRTAPRGPLLAPFHPARGLVAFGGTPRGHLEEKFDLDQDVAEHRFYLSAWIATSSSNAPTRH